jgi:hypothetical protein
MRMDPFEDETLDLKKEKTRLTNLQANKIELELATLKGSLLLYEDVEKELSDIVLSFRAKMLNIPTKIAPTLALETQPQAIEEILRQAIKEALDELSRIDARGIEQKQKKTLRPGASSRSATS